jgi:hypothetical protein
MTDLGLFEHDDIAPTGRKDAAGGEAEQAAPDDRDVAHPGHHRADYPEAVHALAAIGSGGRAGLRRDD